MDTKIRVAIVGYGNIGRHAAESVAAAPDLELAGFVRSNPHPAPIPAWPSVPVTNQIELLGSVQAALLCIPTRLIPQVAPNILEQGINTVDSYDIHGRLADLRIKLDQSARTAGTVAVTAAGWDPGTDSIVRCMLEFMAPRGITNTDFGPGMSMGHSVAAKEITGVRQALAMTVPLGSGRHRRVVYIETEPGYEFAPVAAAIKSDPYFANDETHVLAASDVESLIDRGHGVLIGRKGGSGNTENQMFRFEMRVNNPALTAQVMTAAARAAGRQKPGCYTLIEIPVIDFLPGARDQIIRRLV